MIVSLPWMNDDRRKILLINGIWKALCFQTQTAMFWVDRSSFPCKATIQKVATVELYSRGSRRYPQPSPTCLLSYLCRQSWPAQCKLIMRT